MNGFAPVVVNDTNYLPRDCKEVDVRCLDPTLYAIDAVVPIDLKQVSTWRPNREGGGNGLHWILVGSDLAGWVLAGVFVAAIAGLLKRS